MIANGPIYHCYKLTHFYTLIKLELWKSDGKAGWKGYSVCLYSVLRLTNGLPKYMINSLGESQSGFGVSQT